LTDEDRKQKAREASLAYYYKDTKRAADKARKWRDNNKEYRIEYQRRTKRDRKLKAIAYLGGVCTDCGNKFHPSVYEFHHINPEDKDRDPSKMLSLSWERLSAELDKCKLLCANCHRLEHHRKNYE
jgi:5-methylcytosine-specific restriction endonuclease McrA